MKSFDFCVFIGRFQPFHLAHYELVKEALQQAETAVVILGSYKKAPDPKNPFTAEQREEMIRAALSKEENERVKIIYMEDSLYNENLWISSLQQKVSDVTGDSTKVALIGHEHDHSSYYLRLFPQWKLINMPNFDKYPHATKIRYLYFTHDVEYKNYVHPKTVEYLDAFKKTESFRVLKINFDELREYKEKWEGAPFKPTFVTVDSVVIKSGHILVVRRKGNYGKGLIALPGGFLNQDEYIQTGALRELKEETGIKVTKEELAASITDSKVFDHPDRSLRGRTITHAFLINLKSGILPQVKGQDDADKAWWMPLKDFYNKEESFFEDHFHIISYFVSKF